MSALMTPRDRLTVERDDLADAAAQAQLDGRPVLAVTCNSLVSDLQPVVDGGGQMAALQAVAVIRERLEVLAGLLPGMGEHLADAQAALRTLNGTLMLLLESLA